MPRKTKKHADATAGFDPDSLKQALDAQVRLITGKVPPEVMAKVLKIRQSILRLLPRARSLPPGSQEFFLIERTATDYLPTSLKAFLEVARPNSAHTAMQTGRTPKEILLEQLTLLENKMDELGDELGRHDLDRLLAHGRFLEERFGRPPLSLKPPGSSGS